MKFRVVKIKAFWKLSSTTIICVLNMSSCSLIFKLFPNLAQNLTMKTNHLLILAFFTFLISNTVSFSQNSTQEDTTKIIFGHPPADEILELPIEEEPYYAAGEEAMQQFIKDNLVYPAEAKEKGEQGKVYVRFVVEADGTITNVSIARGVSPSIDAEAMRIVKMMPTWTPGKHRGKPIRTNVVVPIVFKL